MRLFQQLKCKLGYHPKQNADKAMWCSGMSDRSVFNQMFFMSSDMTWVTAKFKCPKCSVEYEDSWHFGNYHKDPRGFSWNNLK